MIILASDHAGFNLKNKLKNWLFKKHIDFVDVGAKSLDNEDSYVEYAKKAMDLMKEEPLKKAILICGSGVGMCIVANRSKNVRAVIGTSQKIVKQAVAHNNANALCIGARNTSFSTAKGFVKIFLNSTFLSGKYLKRIDTIDE